MSRDTIRTCRKPEPHEASLFVIMNELASAGINFTERSDLDQQSQQRALVLHPMLVRMDNPLRQIFTLGVCCNVSHRADVVKDSLAERDFFVAQHGLCVGYLGSDHDRPHFLRND
ncbi:hypothetical protein J0664_10570 [Rhizobium leguminosarum]|nr:hypothetical protein J0664_10570 [Rhizobium leguminosarum]